MLRSLPLDRLLGAAGERCGARVRAMILGSSPRTARLIAPASKLATAKALSLATAASSLAPVLGLGEVDADELYAALDWLVERQPEIEAALAKHHLEDGTLLLYDVSSSWLEGRCCELARFGHSRPASRTNCRSSTGCRAPPTAVRRDRGALQKSPPARLAACQAEIQGTGRADQSRPRSGTGSLRLLIPALAQPLHWRTPRMIFVNSMSDLVHEDMPNRLVPPHL